MTKKHEAPEKAKSAKNWEEVGNREIEASTETETTTPHMEALEVTQGSQAELTEELEVAQAEAKRNYELLLRAKADMENAKRRAQQDIENAHKFGIKRLVEELVPVLDSLEQGLQTKIDIEHNAIKHVLTGLELTYNMLLSTLKKYGIEQLNPEGKPFNPEHHEAMSMVDAEGVEKNTVITVYQKGYLLNGRLLRPARVIVTK